MAAQALVTPLREGWREGVEGALRSTVSDAYGLEDAMENVVRGNRGDAREGLSNSFSA